MKRLAVCVLAASVASVGCSGKSGSDHFLVDETLVNPKIISDRPIKENQTIVTIKLSEPALLELDEITSDAKQAIADEQEAVIGQLKKISQNIQVLYRYRMILNGLAFTAPSGLQDAIRQIPGVKITEPSRVFGRPVTQQSEAHVAKNKIPFDRTSVSFIEADRVHKEMDIRGQQMRVGVLDTGIDYTHRMLGGQGREEDYKAVNPKEANAAFPNRKVVGGIDLVGTDYNAASEAWSEQVPQPDANPIDEGGHGSHVAGTIAGIGDGVETYSGVAPDADLYAIKVFGANGSTSDFVVIAGLEYAADPNQDGDPADKLDVVNLSLGSGFGQPQILYSEAIKNLTHGGTVVVASAGNSGAIDYIVGAPSTADEAISVAASIDNMPHNWTFPAVLFDSTKHPSQLVRAIEGPITKPVEESNVSGKLVYAGAGDKPLDAETAAKLKGNVALMDRGGGVPFTVKIKLAKENGATGVVMANNQPGDPIAMGGEGSFDIPGVMVTKELGDALKEDMKSTDVLVTFNTGKKVEDPRLIDTITNFSSKGPRSMDYLLKPEITAPGANIISAEMGSGDKGIQFSGTSMSGPHIAGVMTLLRQAHKDLSVKQLKSLLMSTATSIHDESGKTYPLSMQGAGRVRSLVAANAPLVMEPAALSLGRIQLGEGKTVRQTVKVTNISDKEVVVDFNTSSTELMKVQVPGSIKLAPKASQNVEVLATVRPNPTQQVVVELDGRLELKSSFNKTTFTQAVPVLAMSSKISQLQAKDLSVMAASDGDSAGAAANFTIENKGAQGGVALPFNLIGFDRKKPVGDVTDSYKSRSCDLESAGYRIVKATSNGETVEMLQIAVKLYEPMTTWHYCEVSVQIDSNNDQLADQELVGISRGHLAGLGGDQFSSLLLNANKARAIRLKYEEELASGNEDASISYIPSIEDLQPMLALEHSTLAVVQVPLKKVALRANGDLAVKVAALYADSEGMAPDDFLGGELKKWVKLSSTREGSGWYDMPEAISLTPKSTRSVSLTKGAGSEKLIVYMPSNTSVRSVKRDPQTTVLKAELNVPKP